MSQYTVSKAMVGGLLGTLLQTIMVYGVAPMLMGRPVDMAAMLGHYCDAGMLAHAVSGGVLFPLGYVALASNWLPGPAVVKGMLWGMILWGVTEGIMAPMLGAGVFSAALGGLPAAARALLGYLVYGATLGSIASVEEPEGRYAAHVLAPVRAR